ncbi:hypothetical protein FACS1894172_18170 [Spirochaetia bacterium]|nr:hypothetical protein FACS1894164_13130 [Spirochaetia bacterium]GHU35867.1 hypothetical protein FACS1894172_18170 [Spirochaetia bacterium]
MEFQASVRPELALSGNKEHSDLGSGFVLESVESLLKPGLGFVPESVELPVPGSGFALESVAE